MKPRAAFKAPPSCGLAIVALCLLTSDPSLPDRLRNVQPGQPLPSFQAADLDGAAIKSDDVAGKVLVLAYLTANQKQSEQVMAAAHRVTTEIGSAELTLIFMTAAVDQGGYFRQLRQRLQAPEPFALDEDRKHYGELGLIVLPTTIVTSKDGKLLHVISGWTRDYALKLELYCRHALGEIDEAEVVNRLTPKPPVKNDARAKAERRHSVAAVLRSRGRTAGAIRELEQALAVDPTYTRAAIELAGMLVEQERIDEAAKIVSDLSARDPKPRGVGLLLGLIHMHRGRLDEAESLLKKALATTPDRIRVHYYLGQLYEKRGECDAALEHYREAARRALNER